MLPLAIVEFSTWLLVTLEFVMFDPLIASTAAYVVKLVTLNVNVPEVYPIFVHARRGQSIVPDPYVTSTFGSVSVRPLMVMAALLLSLDSNVLLTNALLFPMSILSLDALNAAVRFSPVVKLIAPNVVLSITTVFAAIVSFIVVPSLSIRRSDVLLLRSVAFTIMVCVLFSTAMSFVLLVPNIVCMRVAFDLDTMVAMLKLAILHPSVVTFCLPVMLIPVPVPDPVICHPPVQLTSMLSAVIVTPFPAQWMSSIIIAWRVSVFAHSMI